MEWLRRLALNEIDSYVVPMISVTPTVTLLPICSVVAFCKLGRQAENLARVVIWEKAL